MLEFDAVIQDLNEHPGAEFYPSAATYLSRCTAEILVETVVWGLSVCVQNLDGCCIPSSQIQEPVIVVQGC